MTAGWNRAARPHVVPIGRLVLEVYVRPPAGDDEHARRQTAGHVLGILVAQAHGSPPQHHLLIYGRRDDAPGAFLIGLVDGGPAVVAKLRRQDGGPVGCWGDLDWTVNPRRYLESAAADLVAGRRPPSPPDGGSVGRAA